MPVNDAQHHEYAKNIRKNIGSAFNRLAELREKSDGDDEALFLIDIAQSGLEIFQNVSTGLVTVAEAVNSQIRSDEHRDRVISALNDDNDRYRRSLDELTQTIIDEQGPDSQLGRQALLVRDTVQLPTGETEDEQHLAAFSDATVDEQPGEREAPEITIPEGAPEPQAEPDGSEDDVQDEQQPDEQPVEQDAGEQPQPEESTPPPAGEEVQVERFEDSQPPEEVQTQTSPVSQADPRSEAQVEQPSGDIEQQVPSEETQQQQGSDEG